MSSTVDGQDAVDEQDEADEQDVDWLPIENVRIFVIFVFDAVLQSC